MVKIETHPEDQIVQDDHSNEASNLTKIKRKSDLNQSPSKKIKLENYSEQMEGMTAEQKKFVQGLLEENLKLSNEIGSVKEELFKHSSLESGSNPKVKTQPKFQWNLVWPCMLVEKNLSRKNSIGGPSRKLKNLARKRKILKFF